MRVDLYKPLKKAIRKAERLGKNRVERRDLLYGVGGHKLAHLHELCSRTGVSAQAAYLGLHELARRAQVALLERGRRHKRRDRRKGI